MVKVTCGDGFSALLSAEGNVYSWGYNNYGALGIDKENVMIQMKPDSQKPLKFKDEKNAQKRINIIDIDSGLNHTVALTDDKEIFVWGRRMGIYPQIELTLASVEKRA